jgi:hypothetical protein
MEIRLALKLKRKMGLDWMLSQHNAALNPENLTYQSRAYVEAEN